MLTREGWGSNRIKLVHQIGSQRCAASRGRFMWSRSDSSAALSCEASAAPTMRAIRLRWWQACHGLDDPTELSGIEVTPTLQNFCLRAASAAQVRKVLDLHSKELRIIFLLYAMMDTSTADAMQRVHTMNLKEFQMLLTDTSLLDDTLTEDTRGRGGAEGRVGGWGDPGPIRCEEG